MEFPKTPVALSRLKRFAPPVVGALGGFAYYYFIGCSAGTCPISSNPWTSTAYGVLIGAVLTIGRTKESSQETGT